MFEAVRLKICLGGCFWKSIRACNFKAAVLTQGSMDPQEVYEDSPGG